MKQVSWASSLCIFAACTGQLAGGGTMGPSTPSYNGAPPPDQQQGGNYQATAYTPPPGPGVMTTPAAPQTGFGKTIAERNAVINVEKQLEEVIALARQKCGAPNLSVTVVWTDYLSLNDADFDGRTRDNVYGCALSQLEGPIRQMASTCGDDATVRSAVNAELRQIVGHPRVGPVSAEHPSHIYNLNNGTMEVSYQICTSNTYTTDMLKKL